MIPSIYFISLIFVSVTVIYFLDHRKVNDKLRPFIEGLFFGILASSGMYIHFYYLDPTAIFPKINVFVSHTFFVVLSFYLFGYKGGLVTLFFVLISRIFLTEEFLVYSLILIFLSAINGYYFNRIFHKRNSKSPNYKTTFLLVLSQSTISTIVFFTGPAEAFSKNIFQMLIFLFPISSFVNLLIAMAILRTRYQKRILSDMENEKTLLSNVLYNLTEAVMVIDSELRILRMNHLAEILTGFESNEISNKTLSEICLLKDKKLFETISDQIKTIKEGEIINHYDIILLSRKGEEIPIDCKISYVKGKESGQDLYIISFKDLRELKKAENVIKELERRFKQFFEFSLEGIWRYDIKKPVDISLPAEEQIKMFFEYGYLADCNDTFAKMYGYTSKDELIGIPLSATLVPEDENNIEYLKTFIKNNYRMTNAESVEVDKFGNTKYFINSLYGIVQDGFIYSAWGIQIDITEEKLTTKQVRDNNRLLLSILNAPKGIIIFSLDRNYCYTAFSISHKETMKKIWGVDIEIGMNMLDVIKLEADRIKAKNNFDKALNGEYLNLVEQYGDETLQRSFWLDNYSPIFDGSEIIGVAVYVTDISLQKGFELELERKNLLLNTLINTIPDSIYVKDKNLRKILTNKTDLKWMGYEDENQVLGKRDDEIFSEEFAKISIEDDRKVIDGTPVINREEKIITKDNQEIYILTTKVPMYDNNGNIVGLVGVGRDITETKKYLNELEESQQKLKILFNQSFQFIGLLTPSGILLEANQTACDFAGISPDEVKNKYFADTVWWNHSKTQQDKLREAIKSAAEGNFFRMEITHLNKDKEERVIDFSLMPIKNINGEVVYLIAEGRDITDMKNLEIKLTASEEKYRILVEASMDGISIVNPDGYILFQNEKFKELFKSVSDEEKKINLHNLVFKDDLEKLKQEIRISLSQEKVTTLTIRFNKNSNDFFWAELSLKTFTDMENIRLIMCVIRDITFRKQIEDELKKRLFELEKINSLMVGREVKMVELKREVNRLLKQMGQPPKYPNEEI
jgi:PAS domain S-box-containing protein